MHFSCASECTRRYCGGPSPLFGPSFPEYSLVDGLEELPLVFPDFGVVDLLEQLRVLVDEPRFPQDVGRRVLDLRKSV